MSDGEELQNKNFEAALITAIIDTKDIRSVIKHKIDKDFFFTAEGKAAYIWLTDWYENPRYPDTPSWDSFLQAFPHFEREDIDESVAVLCDHVRSNRLYSDIAGILQKVSEVTGDSPLEGFDILRAQTSQLVTRYTIDNAVDVKDRFEAVLEDYVRISQEEVKLKGRPYPWPALNAATMGAQNGQLIIIYGRPKTKKTWLALEVLRSFHLNGALVHSFSQELSTEEFVRRYVALSAQVPYSDFLKGQLQQPDEDRLFGQMDVFEKSPPFIVDSAESMGEACLMELQAKLDDSHANAALIDGAHNLGTWKELYPIIKGLKRIAKSRNIPIVLTTHAKRAAKNDDSGSGDDFAHSDAFFQECDLAIRASCDIENLKRHEVLLTTTAIREGTPCRFLVHARLAWNLSQKQVLSFDDDGTPGDEGGPDYGDGEEDER